jgi:hypothetical protein
MIQYTLKTKLEVFKFTSTGTIMSASQLEYRGAPHITVALLCLPFLQSNLLFQGTPVFNIQASQDGQLFYAEQAMLPPGGYSGFHMEYQHQECGILYNSAHFICN